MEADSKVNVKITVFKELRTKIDVKLFCSITYTYISTILMAGSVAFCHTSMVFCFEGTYFCCYLILLRFIRSAHALYTVKYDNYWINDNYHKSYNKSMRQDLVREQACSKES